MHIRLYTYHNVTDGLTGGQTIRNPISVSVSVSMCVCVCVRVCVCVCADGVLADCRSVLMTLTRCWPVLMKASWTHCSGTTAKTLTTTPCLTPTRSNSMTLLSGVKTLTVIHKVRRHANIVHIFVVWLSRCWCCWLSPAPVPLFYCCVNACKVTDLLAEYLYLYCSVQCTVALGLLCVVTMCSLRGSLARMRHLQAIYWHVKLSGCLSICLFDLETPNLARWPLMARGFLFSHPLRTLVKLFLKLGRALLIRPAENCHRSHITPQCDFLSRNCFGLQMKVS